LQVLLEFRDIDDTLIRDVLAFNYRDFPQVPSWTSQSKKNIVVDLIREIKVKFGQVAPKGRIREELQAICAFDLIVGCKEL